MLLFLLLADFQSDQLVYPRVKVAQAEAGAGLEQLFLEKKLAYPPVGLVLVALKEEGLIEAWVPGGSTYVHLKDYKICARSGGLGRKRRAGDGQVPEGFYEVAAFNPSSSYYLALKVSYPNAADRVLNRGVPLGGDIMIHGNCVTIGCLPIQDEHIKELYWLAVQAKAHGAKKIPVYLFPFRFHDNLAADHVAHPQEEWAQQWSFWENLREGYLRFQKHPLPLAVSVAKDGHYVFAQ